MKMNTIEKCAEVVTNMAAYSTATNGLTMLGAGSKVGISLLSLVKQSPQDSDDNEIKTLIEKMKVEIRNEWRKWEESNANLNRAILEGATRSFEQVLPQLNITNDEIINQHFNDNQIADYILLKAEGHSPELYDSRSKDVGVQLARKFLHDIISKTYRHLLSTPEFMQKLQTRLWPLIFDNFEDVSDQISSISNQITKLADDLSENSASKNESTFGIDELTDNKQETLTYRKNLSNDLPYVSRTEFGKKLECDTNDTFYTEEEIYGSVFLENSQYYGAFIHGEGGIGKTRLMLELGRTAQLNGWKVFHLLKEFKGWETLQLIPNENYCFMFDYVEENNNFTENIIDILNTHYLDTKIRILANSRDTFLEQHTLNKTHFFEVNLQNANNPTEKKFQHHVIKKILGKKRPDLFSDNSEFNNLIVRPSFAVFILEGEKENGNGTCINDEIDFHTIKEFETYITRRLALTFRCKSFNIIDSNVFYLLSSLPIKKTKEHSNITRNLRTDGWIEFDKADEKFKSAYNDTIIDELLIAYLNKTDFKYKDILQDELEMFFGFTSKYSNFEHCFRSFDRISPKSKLKDIEKELLETFEKENYNFIYELKKIGKIFAKSKLIYNSVNKLIFINKHGLIPLYDLDYSGTLSRAIAQVFDMENRNKIRIINDLFVEWIDYDREKSHEIFSKKYEGSFLIPKYYDYHRRLEGRLDDIKLPSIDIDTIALQWIRQYFYLKDASFIINRYLKSKLSHPNEIANEINHWANIFSQDKKEIISLVNNFICNENSDHSLIEELIKKLIISGDYYIEIKNVHDEIIQINIIQHLNINLEKHIEIQYAYNLWVLNNPAFSKTPYVIANFFKNNGFYDEIEEGLMLWLDEGDPLSEDANNIFQNIKTSFTQKPKLQQAIKNWIIHNPTSSSVPFVVGTFFKNNGFYEEIEEGLKLWFDEGDPLSDDAKYIYQKINIKMAISEKPELELAFIRWLEKNKYSKFFACILIRYINRGGNINAISPTIICDWINENESDDSFYIVTSKYLKGYQSITNIEDVILLWVNSSDKNIGLICKYLFYGGSYSNIESALEKNLATAPEVEVIKKIIEKLKERDPLRISQLSKLIKRIERV